MTGTITIIMGRATKDPVIQHAKDSGSEYITLDLAVSQRNQEGKEETMYYQCYFNSFLAQRLIKAGVRKGTGILVYGDLELYPFTYQQGQKAGQPGVHAKVTVKDWQFTLSNKQEKTADANHNQNVQGTNMNHQAAQPYPNPYPAGSYPPSMMQGNAAPNYGMMQTPPSNNGFSGIPENCNGQLPFN